MTKKVLQIFSVALFLAKCQISVKGVVIYIMFLPIYFYPYKKIGVHFEKERRTIKRGGVQWVVRLHFFRCITALKTYTVLQKTYF